MNEVLKVIISGGGTGGHIFPAVSIANEIRAKRPDAEILFVGAEGRMEMQRVPAAGYPIKGLPIAGFTRLTTSSGVTNMLLANNARRICVAYDGMERFFPAGKIMLTGNPVRQNLLNTTLTKEEAVRELGLVPGKRTILIVGGSLGARTINDSILGNLPLIKQQQQVQFVWQTGKYYSEEIHAKLERRDCPANLVVTDFIADMAQAYAAADLVISRAGAGSISEFCLLGKPAILVPSPNVAEDHQTKNALALVQKEAALYCKRPVTYKRYST